MTPTLQYPVGILSDLRVLVLDDIALRRNRLVDALKRIGISLITQAKDWTSGSKLLTGRKQEFDIALCGMRLGRRHRNELLRHAVDSKVKGCILRASDNGALAAATNNASPCLPMLGALPEAIESSELESKLLEYCGACANAVPRVEEMPQRRWTRNELYRALCCNQFVPFFQPKVDLATGQASCVEVLARWEHPELGVLPPSQFIEAMEEMELIDQLTDCLLQKSLLRIRECAMRGWNVGIAINFSPLTLQDHGMPARISALVRHFGVDPGKVTIEVTETAASQDPEAVFQTLTQLRAAGFKISIDDFGMGYSSLEWLSRMPFTEIKIDRAFVSGAVKGSKSTIILEMIVELAHRLGMRTVAEAMTAQEVIDAVRTLDIDVLVLDLSMPGSRGLELLMQIKKERPALKVLILSMYEEGEYAALTIKAGAQGYLMKGCTRAELLKAIRQVGAGLSYVTQRVADELELEGAGCLGRLPHERLSDRQLEVFELLVKGESLAKISEQLELSIKTVGTHKVHIMQKMGMSTVLELARYAEEHGLIPHRDAF